MGWFDDDESEHRLKWIMARLDQISATLKRIEDRQISGNDEVAGLKISFGQPVAKKN